MIFIDLFLGSPIPSNAKIAEKQPKNSIFIRQLLDGNRPVEELLQMDMPRK